MAIKKIKQVNSKIVWGHIWNHTDFDLVRDESRVLLEEQSKRWSFMRKEILSKFGKLRDLKIIEIGSGIGDYSLILAKNGAKVTLLDYSDEALAQAKLRFEAHGVKAKYIKINLLEPLPRAVKGKYDLSMSFGLVEHFKGEERLTIVKAHHDFLINGGKTFISVPNKLSFPYQYWMHKRKKAGQWEYGLEIPFSRWEILTLAQKSGFCNINLIGTPVFADIDSFLLSGRLRKFVNNLQIKTPFDNYFGYAIVLSGER